MYHTSMAIAMQTMNNEQARTAIELAVGGEGQKVFFCLETPQSELESTYSAFFIRPSEETLLVGVLNIVLF